MVKSSSELSLQVEVGCLSPFMPMPTGPGVGHFKNDGSFRVQLEEFPDLYEGDKRTKLNWTFGLMKGVDEEHIYIGIAPMVYAKIVNIKENSNIESWLQQNHPK